MALYSLSRVAGRQHNKLTYNSGEFGSHFNLADKFTSVPIVYPNSVTAIQSYDNNHNYRNILNQRLFIPTSVTLFKMYDCKLCNNEP